MLVTSNQFFSEDLNIFLTPNKRGESNDLLFVKFRFVKSDESWMSFKKVTSREFPTLFRVCGLITYGLSYKCEWQIHLSFVKLTKKWKKIQIFFRNFLNKFPGLLSKPLDKFLRPKFGAPKFRSVMFPAL